MIPTLDDLNVSGKRVLVRVDFNVPQDSSGHITDDSRVKASLATIEELLNKGARLILMSHLGRPGGKKEAKYSLKPCAERLSELLKRPVLMAPDCQGEKVQEMVRGLQDGEVLLLENLRFYKEEEEPNEAFVKALASLGEVYVNDAFGTAHRAHASTAAIAAYFEGVRAAGRLLQKEIAFLGEALLSPKRPFYALIGGAKVSSKLGVLKALFDKADALFIGGAMAYTFLKAKGEQVGLSLVEESLIPEAKKLLQNAKCPLYLPEDSVLDDESVVTHAIPENRRGLDIGPKTAALWSEKLKEAKTIFWNGPVGLFEDPLFAKGTKKMAEAIVKSGALTIVGGGDSVAAIESQGLASKISHLSTGGGASLEYIEKGTLPGIEALKQ